MGAMEITFNPDQMGTGSLTQQRFAQRMVERNYPSLGEFSEQSDADINAVLKALGGKEVYSYMNDYGFTVLVAINDAADVLIGNTMPGSFQVNIAARSLSKLQELMAALRKMIPPIRSDDRNIVPVNFWVQAPNGAATYRTRKVVVPTWEDVSANYPSDTRAALPDIMKFDRDIEGGKLLLWYGVPGTGKSYAIRALANEWRGWCETNYIVDPERFFGEAHYMIEVILDAAGHVGAPATESGATEKADPWRLLIIEDADEFLTVDAKRRQGQAMSRLLNIADGFIGQGLNLLILITTNEPIEKIHPAVQRQGRCLANVEFGEFSEEEATSWLRKWGVQRPLNGQRKLSDLYALARQTEQIKSTHPTKTMGFRP